MDYARTFGHVGFTTHPHETLDKVRHAITAMEREIGANLVHDHFHPEIAGPLQLAVHFLKTRCVQGFTMP